MDLDLVDARDTVSGGGRGQRDRGQRRDGASRVPARPDKGVADLGDAGTLDRIRQRRRSDVSYTAGPRSSRPRASEARDRPRVYRKAE